jgi:hypothetical protein
MPTPDMQYRTLGATGERVSAIGMGGWHLGLPTVSEDLAIRLIRTALDRGINFLDNSWDYFNGLFSPGARLSSPNPPYLSHNRRNRSGILVTPIPIQLK